MVPLLQSNFIDGYHVNINMHMHTCTTTRNGMQPRGPASHFHSILLITGQNGSMQRASFDTNQKIRAKILEITQNGAVQPVSMPSGESVLCCIAGPRDLSHYGSWNCFSYRVSDCKVALQCYVILSSLHSLLLNFT